MSSQQQPIQALSYALDTLEARINAIDPSTDGSNYPRVTTTQQGPIQMLQDRLRRIGWRVYGLELATGTSTEPNEHTDTSNSKPITFLQGIIDRLVVKTNTVEGEHKHEPAEEEPTQEPEEEPTQELEETTDAPMQLMYTYDGVAAKLKSISPQPAYYIMVISFPTVEGGILTFTSPSNYIAAPTDDYHQAWTAYHPPSTHADITIYARTENTTGAPTYYHTLTCNTPETALTHTINTTDWRLHDSYFSVFKLVKRGLKNCFMFCLANEQAYRFTYRIERMPDGWTIVGIFSRAGQYRVEYGDTTGTATRPWYMWVTFNMSKPVPNIERWIRVKHTASGDTIDIPLCYESASTLGTWIIYDIPERYITAG